MGVRFPSVQSNTIVNATLTTTVETVLAVLPPFTPPLDSSVILVLGRCTVTTGTASTGFIPRLRRGTTTAGTLISVGTGQYTAASGVTELFQEWYFDNPGAVSGQQYCLTGQQVAATAGATCTDAAIYAFAL